MCNLFAICANANRTNKTMLERMRKQETRMSRHKSPGNKALPENMRVRRGGYYSYVNPLDGVEYGLGRDKAQAVAEAHAVNNHVAQARKQTGIIDRIAAVAVDEKEPGLLLDDSLEKYIFSLDEIMAKSIKWEYNPDHGTGVYFLFDGDDLVYVGRSEQVRYRLNTHAFSDKKWQRYSLITIHEKEHRNIMEAFYIAAYWPFYNEAEEKLPDFMVKHLPGGARTDRPMYVTTLVIPEKAGKES